MVDYTYKASNTLFEDRYIQWSEVNLPAPGSDEVGQGTLYAWGRNSSGALGVNDMTHRSSPVQVGSLNDWYEISNALTTNSDGFTIALRYNRTLWAWGFNGSGQLGQSTLTHRSSPVQIGTLADWKEVSATSRLSMAIKLDGTLWYWGGANGPNLALRSSPVQVGSTTTWNKLSIGGTNDAETIFLISKNGSLWAFGDNTDGKLGLGQNAFELFFITSPVQVGSLTDWSRISVGPLSISAIKTDGTLWTWGNNGNGQLGLGDRTHRSSPTQVGSLTNWKDVSTGANFCLATRTDGTLWTWGFNLNGQLGLSDVNSRSSPTQVGALTNWSRVTASKISATTFSLSIKTDGTLWSWGRNFYGELGLNQNSATLSFSSSPVQVGSLTTWGLLSQDTGSSVFATLKKFNYS